MGLKVSPVTGASVSETVRVQDTIIPVWLSAMKADAEAGAADDLANRVSYLFLGYAANVSAYKLLFAVAPVGSALTVVITKGTVSTIGDTIATLTIPDGASGFLSGTIGESLVRTLELQKFSTSSLPQWGPPLPVKESRSN
jgi:hypothetical protein